MWEKLRIIFTVTILALAGFTGLSCAESGTTGEDASANSSPGSLKAQSASSIDASNLPSDAEQDQVKPARKTPPFPHKGTDMETHMREQEIYMQWMHDNNENVSTIIVKLKPEIDGTPRKLITHAKAKEIGDVAGIKLEPERLTVPNGWQILKFSKHYTEKVAEKLCAKLKEYPDVLACDPNGAIYNFSIPTDPLYNQQWSFNAGPGSANIGKAWDATTGVATTVVAVLDSGITTHEDLASSRILPGYDFITDPVVANDGGGRDADPSDPGNWVTQAESNGTGSLAGCPVTNSDWHGTHITGIIGATANNPVGVAGINWAAKLLPVRVTGKCGKNTNGADDLKAAILWAAGVDIGTPALNPNPAQVINMSLGAIGTCPTSIQDAIDQATNKGAVIIAAAGNNGISQSFWPANCSNVLTVVATNQIGNRSSYSNWGAGVGVSAPGDAILSTVNPGTTSPVAGSAYVALSGTSQAAAHVSGIASLMLASNPKLTPFEIREIIKASAKPFAQSSAIIFGDCGSGSCGTGIVNAAQAVKLSKMGKPAKGFEFDVYRVPQYLITSLPNGQVMGWGKNDFGQLGGSNPASVLSPAMVPGLTKVDRVFAGGATSWFLLSTGEAYALGQGSYCSKYFETAGLCVPSLPQYYFSFFGGDPMAVASGTPVRTPLLDNAKQIVVGYKNTGSGTSPSVFALTSSGKVLAWGDDSYGSLGLGLGVGLPNSEHVVQTPTAVGGLPPIQRIIATWWGALALDQSGNVWGWGEGAINNNCNIFGNGAPQYSTVPIQIGALANIADIQTDVYGNIFVVVKQDGTVWQWGYDPNSIVNCLPVQISIDHVVATSIYSSFGYAIRTDGSLWKWDISSSSPPTQIRAGGALGFVDASSYSPMVRMADGHILELAYLSISSQSPEFANYVYGYGTGYSGRLNVANTTVGDDSDLKVAISSDTQSISIGQNFNYVVAIRNLGTGAANNSVVSIALPTAVRINSVPSGCSVAGQIITCNLGNMAASYATSLSINVQALNATSTTATAYASSDSYDFYIADNVAGVDVAIQAPSSSVDNDVPTLPEWGEILLGGLLLASLLKANRRKYLN